MSDIKLMAITSPVVFTNGSDESSTKTLLQIAAPSNQRIKIKQWGVFFNEETGDATPATPFLAELGKHTSADGTASALTLKRRQPSTVTIQSSAKETFTVNATITDKLDSAYVNAQTGYEVIYPMGDEVIIEQGEAVNLQVSSGATLSTGNVSVIAKIFIEE